MSLDIDFHERVARLGREGQSFAVATVVGRRAPVSSHLGDRAIVFADGRMEGFVGGACSHEIVRTQALAVLASGQGRIVSIRPDAASVESTADRVVVPMTCASEGAVDVYIEPFVRPRLLVVVGATPIAAALARLGRSLDYRVVRVADERERADIESDAARFGFTAAALDALDDLLKPATGPDDRAVVVASQGHYDEEALASALTHAVPYVALVASRSRGAAVKALLEEQGVANVARLRNPAGLDLGAKTAPEVALSILAEIVQLHASQARTETASASGATPGVPEAALSVAIDPVCHMDVEIATARHKIDVDGVTYYFCCAGCQSRFLKQPHEYLSRTP
jgi:xanthine dehydrogenase accessory factor